MSIRVVVVIGLSCGLAAGALAWWHHQPHSRSQPSYAANPETDSVFNRIASSGPMSRPRDFFRIIDRPEYLSVEDAIDSMSDDEVVLGLAVAGEYRAYPINYLNDHEMVREETGGFPLLITW